MSGPVWRRIEGPLIELSLTNSEASKHSGKWEIRIEGDTLELKLLDDGGIIHDILTVERSGGDAEKLTYNGKAFDL